MTDHLAHSPALQELSADQREVIYRLGEELSFAAREKIIREGDQADCFFILLSGELEVSNDQGLIGKIEAGGLVGEMALFNDNVRTASVSAVGEARVLRVLTHVFNERVLHGEPAAVRMLSQLGKTMVERLQERDALFMARLGQDDARTVAEAEAFAPFKKRLLADWALRYHAVGRPGKIEVTPTKQTTGAADLSVAYSPGVAEPCLAIEKDPGRARQLTGRGQLVGVVTNGTAVLGLGDIGPLAAKPVMEGKAVLFKRFADVDAFDIEIAETDPDKLIDIVCALAPTFGGINLEDIRAPECFRIEQECQARLDIPVFHDDQHGTAIIAAAALLNALDRIEKTIEDLRVVFSGAGAAGFATAKHFIALGVKKENLILTDVAGVVYEGRGDNNYLDELASKTEMRTLAQALEGADVFVGVSAGDVLTAEMLKTMARDPVVFALANPTPEIHPGRAKRARPDVVMATGRSDFPNQVNNVIAFPYMFRGALDTQARKITKTMKLAATGAIAALARQPDWVTGDDLFGREYLIPRPFDPRLLVEVASAVARAAIEDGVAPASFDVDAYRRRLASSRWR